MGIFVGAREGPDDSTILAQVTPRHVNLGQLILVADERHVNDLQRCLSARRCRTQIPLRQLWPSRHLFHFSQP